MSIRITALYIFVTFLCIYAWKDWFKSLCGLILLMAVIEHPDMPKTVLGIQGLNPWNLLFAMIFLAWAASRRREGLTWDMPRHISVLLLMYLGVILFGVLRAVLDRSYIQDYPLKSLISEELINTVKWVLPGILLFDGCRTRRQVVIVLACILSIWCLIAVQLHRLLPLGSILQDGGGIEYTRIAIKNMGYAATDLSVMLAGASWGLLAAVPLVQRKYWVMILAAAGIVFTAMALTGGRAGYLAWGGMGLVLCLLKWRKYLLLAPIVVMLLPMIFPGAVGRMLQGFGQTDVAGQSTVDDYSITSGRTLIWPHVIDKICESPLVGHGRLAMARTGLMTYLALEYSEGEAVGHAHNMYLDTLLDNGILGSLPIFFFWGLMVLYSTRLFRSDNRLCSAVGGVALASMLAELLGGIAGQRFYPREHTMGMWIAMFLMLRVYVEERQIQARLTNTGDSWNSQTFGQQMAIV